jgi:hypothetical protein
MVSGKFYYKSGQERAGWERVDRGIDDGTVEVAGRAFQPVREVGRQRMGNE